MPPFLDDLIVAQFSICQLNQEGVQSLDGDVMGVVFEKSGDLPFIHCGTDGMGSRHIEDKDPLFSPCPGIHGSA